VVKLRKKLRSVLNHTLFQQLQQTTYLGGKRERGRERERERENIML
jgi:hypothetical protein